MKKETVSITWSGELSSWASPKGSEGPTRQSRVIRSHTAGSS